MAFLSIDSSNQSLSGTIFKESPITSFCIEPQDIQSTRNQKSSMYLPQIIKLFEDSNNLSLQEITLIAVTIGPGSFTGIRTALSIAKTLACELNLKIFTANNFELIRFEQNLKNDEPIVLHAGKSGYFISRDSDYNNSKTNFFAHEIPHDLQSRVREFQEKNPSLVLAQYCNAKSEEYSLKNFDQALPYYLREPSIGKKLG